MKDPLFQQLQQRIDCNRKAMRHAGDVFISMVDKNVYNDMQFKESFPSDINELELFLIKKNIFFSQIDLNDGDWWKLCTCKILAFLKEDDTPVILENHFATYTFVHPYTKRSVKISRRSDYDDIFKREAFTLNYPLPDRALKLSDIGRMAVRLLSRNDVAYLVMSCVAVVLLNMLTPYFCKIVFNEIIPSSDEKNLLPTSIILLSASLALIVMIVTRSYVAFRLKDKMEYEMQSALMIRVLNLPTSFHKRFSPGDLSMRVLSISSFSAELTDDTITTILTLLASGFLGIQLFLFGGDLFWLAVVMLGIYFVIMMAFFKSLYDINTDINPRIPKVQGLLFNIFSGMQKIKTTGAEVRAFDKWASLYALSTRHHVRFPKLSNILNVLQTYFHDVILLVIMIGAYFYGLSLSDYIAFSAVLLIAVTILDNMGNIVSSLMSAIPLLDLSKPILEEPQEGNDRCDVVKEVSGDISINRLRFAYADSDVWILNDLTLHINAGEYVALVGKSGCGKSTLLRLLLGFERPQAGTIFYGQYNLEDMHGPTLRRCSLSTCLQDGQIFDGTILENICISVPTATEEDAWEAARLAAFDNDIRHMPDGMNTVIGTKGQQVSGGQRQRLLIARALIGKPDVLFLDEATSALDNLSQKIVADTFNNLRCTRITIAHRLSTIRHCDRIIFIDGGKVAEDGSYDELVAMNGLFAELVRNQEGT